MAKRNPDPSPEDKQHRPSLGGLKKALGIFRFALPYRGYFIGGLVFLFLSTLTILLLPHFIGRLLDAAGVRAPGQEVNNGRFFGVDQSALAESLGGFATDRVDQVLFVLIAILVLQALFSFGRVYLFAQVSERAMADIRENLYQRIISLPIRFFEERRVGELTSRLASDVTQLQDVLSLTLAEFIRQILTLVLGILILLTQVSARLTGFMLLTFPVMIILALVFGRFIRRLSRDAQDQLAESNVIVEETFQNVSIVKAFANEWLELGRYRDALKRVVETALKGAIFRGAFISFIFLGLFGGVIVVIWYGVKMIQDGLITPGQLLEFSLYTAFIGGSVAGMGNLYGQLQKTMGASERIRMLLDEEPEIDPADTLEPAAFQPIDGEIEFNNLSFAYPTRPDVTVLHNFNLRIAAGEKIALVGHSGAGKSTIAQLILRFYEPQRGELRVDGRNATTYDLSAYRRNVGVVPQEVILFGGTIRENIAYGNSEATEDQIRSAARQANALDFIEGFPEGLDTVVGERGVKLSGGQRQRVAIARAILKDPAILILDEATSSLDAESENQVQSALDHLMAGRTTVIIAHRLSTIRNVDRIYVLESGRIIESGTHEELMQPEGAYFNLLQLQLKE